MCAIFGLIDYEHQLSTKQKNKMISALAKECAVRGTDATGIAYNYNGSLRVYKRPLAAHRMHFRVPNGVHTILGHTRMTTQGSEEHNQNNHPFIGNAGDTAFALAHNGVLWNDKDLRQQENLPTTHIETDSYVAAQLIEKQRALTFDSLKYMAEKVAGSFVFTVLDEADGIWLVKGDNPLTIFSYDGFLLYASTEEILLRTEQWLRLHHQERYDPEEGDILRIDQQGEFTCGSFMPKHSYRHFWRQYPNWLEDEPEITPSDDLLDVARAMGVSEADVETLFEYGCAPDEIAELLYQPTILSELLGQLKYSYI